MQIFLILSTIFLSFAYVIASSLLAEKIIDLMVFNEYTLKTAITEGLTPLGRILFMVELPLMLVWWVILILIDLLFDLKLKK